MLDSALDWLGSKGASSFMVLGTMVGYTTISAFMGWKSGVDAQLAVVIPAVEKINETHEIVIADHDTLMRVETVMNSDHARLQRVEDGMDEIGKTVTENRVLGERFREAIEE